MVNLYKHIEALGKENGYKNMTVLCKAAGVPRTTMSELNAGRSKDLSKPNAQKFADLLGLPLDSIYGTETEKTPAEADVTFDDFTYAMYGESKELTEEQKMMLLDMARMMKKRSQERKSEDGK